MNTNAGTGQRVVPRRSGRGRKRERPQAAAPAYITRKIPYFEFLDEEGLVTLEDQADWLMQEIGLEFRGDPEALRLWKEAGADVNQTRVKLPRGMARELCKTIPSQFIQVARNPDRSVQIGGRAQVFGCVYGPLLCATSNEGAAMAPYRIWKIW